MTMPTLPFDVESPNSGDTIRQKSDAEVSHSEHNTKIQRSALWAAYGDALGWISELTDETGLKRRTNGATLDRPIAWKRHIGGRGGVLASLPAGCYSDDTQLRLATGRAIGADGFYVEAFAKVELPVWQSYELGGGRGTNAAATNLVRPKVPWFANTFKGWTESGGNGAAMRIQPHVWAAPAPGNPDSFLPDVIRNAVCTHSHPTGMMGAVLHALTLAHTVANGRHPSSDDLDTIIDVTASVPTLIQNDFEVWNYWRTAFERESGSFSEAWEQAICDSRDALRAAGINDLNLTGAERYSVIVDNLMLRERKHIGNGILTAIAAVGLIWCEEQPADAMRIAANAIGTDTDTIATMAGAILGVTAETDPLVEVMDANLIRSEAVRLSGIAQGRRPVSHKYPDLLHWSAPRTRSDTLLSAGDGSLVVCGLGPAQAQSTPIESSRGDFLWQWIEIESGQTMLIKRRKTLGQYVKTSASPDSVLPVPIEDAEGEDEKLLEKSQETLDLDAALAYTSENIANNGYVGAALRRVVNKGTKGQVVAFVARLIDLLDESQDPKGGMR